MPASGKQATAQVDCPPQTHPLGDLSEPLAACRQVTQQEAAPALFAILRFRCQLVILRAFRHQRIRRARGVAPRSGPVMSLRQVSAGILFSAGALRG